MVRVNTASLTNRTGAIPFLQSSDTSFAKLQCDAFALTTTRKPERHAGSGSAITSKPASRHRVRCTKYLKLSTQERKKMNIDVQCSRLHACVLLLSDLCGQQDALPASALAVPAVGYGDGEVDAASIVGEGLAAAKRRHAQGQMDSDRDEHRLGSDDCVRCVVAVVALRAP